jgi:DNA-binding response OmpR family regulator
MVRQTILIIDDIAEHRDIVGRLLRAAGFRVVEATPGPHVTAIAHEHEPALIVLGLSLPGQPSWEAVRHLHSKPALRDVPILGTTVFTTLISRARVRSIGCVDCMDKPFDLDALLARITSLIPPAPSLAA